MKLRKSLFAVTALALAVTVVACNGGEKPTTSVTTETPASTSVTTSTPEPVVEKKEVLTGLGSIVALSTDTATGSIKSVDITTCAASFDKDGVILAVEFDVVQIPVKINTETKKFVLNDTAKQVKDAGSKVVESKQELLERYGMKATSSKSGLGLEAYEQLRNLATFVKGKTMAEVIGREKDALASSVSITTNELFAALMEAYETKNAPVLTPKTAQVATGVGMVIAVTETQIEVYLSSVTLGNDEIVGAYIDTFQIPLVVSTISKEVDGVPTNIDIIALKTPTTTKQFKDAGFRIVESKKELGSRYGMYYKNTSGVLSVGTGHGEWFEQADRLEKWTLGKAVSALDITLESNKFPATHPLASTVTVTVDKYLEVLKEAATYAKALPQPTPAA